MKKNKNVVIVLGIVVLVIAGIFSMFLRNSPSQNADQTTVTQIQTESITYQGREGVDALTLLEERAEVEEDNGFVTSINGRTAQDERREFWSFYVNGKQAEIGARDYETEDTDTIEWKIEQY